MTTCVRSEAAPAAFLPPLELENPVERLVAKTPWWAVSIALHAVLALLLGFFWVAQAVEEEGELLSAEIRKPVQLPAPTFTPDSPVSSPQEIESNVTSDNNVVFRRNVEISDHPESDDNDLFNHQKKGDSFEFVADKPFKGKGINDTIGGGGGGGGDHGGPLSGRRTLATEWGKRSKNTEDAVLEALKWLARHQDPDGSWSVAGYTKQCRQSCTPHPGHEDFGAGVTGLSLLAFLGAGYSHVSKDTHDGICFGTVVKNGLQWMMERQDIEGCIGSRGAQKYMYNHTLCALALCEAYGLTSSILFKDQAQSAVDFTLAAQNPGKGWRYSAKSGDNDSSVTGWAVMVLKSAELSGLAVPPGGYDGARAWLDEVTDGQYGRVGYTHRNTGKVFVPGLNENFDHHEALTAIAVMARIFMDRDKRDPRLSNGCELLMRDKPRWDGNLVDYYYWYYASLALFQYDGPKGPKWNGWNEDMKNALLPSQNPTASGCRRGSWEPVDRWSGEGGRVYGTAINALTLEVYYRYANVFGNR